MRMEMKKYMVAAMLLLAGIGVRGEGGNGYWYLPGNGNTELRNKGKTEPYLPGTAELVSLSCLYKSVDQHGDTLTVSGRVYFPREGRAKAFVLQPHYTITSNRECPSECDMPDLILHEMGYAVLLPDYVGYGVTRERNHPYLDYDVAARNTLDLYFGAKALLESLDRLPENDSLILVGYSQGAQTALATLKLIETEHPEIAVKRCYLGSGPYDVARTYDVSIATNKVGLQFTIPMLIMGTSWSYDLELDPYYFMNKKTIERSEKYVFSKEYSAGDVVLLNRMGCSHKVSRYMTPEGMDKTLPETRRLYEGLIRSSLVHVSETDTMLGDWTPKAPLYVLHSTEDRGVPFENALSLQLMLETKGVTDVEYDFGKFGDHLPAFVRFLQVLKSRL